MSTEAKSPQQNPELDNDTINQFFDFDKNLEDQEDEETDVSEYDGAFYEPGNENDDKPQEEADSAAEEEEDDLFSEVDDNAAEEDAPNDKDFSDEDLADFNKKLNKDFSSVEELKSYLNKEDHKEVEKESENKLEVIESRMDYISPLLDPNVTNDESLVRKELETVAINEGKDLADEEVQFDLDDKIQRIKDAYQMDIRANSIRKELKSMYDKFKVDADGIKAQKAQEEKQLLATEKEATMNAFAEIFKQESFFGIKPEKEVIQKAYKDANSGEFINKLKTDKNLLAKLAMIDAYGDQIQKLASTGLTYSDGVKSVHEEFNLTQKQSSGNTIAKAQQKGSVSSNNSRGLISSLTM